MDKEYIELFKLIEDILSKQEAQKMQGLNDYNMVNVVRKASHEVGMHSNVIYSLINPNGLHYQNDLFLNLFIEKVLELDIKDFEKILEVNVEELTNENRRIDFTIKSAKYFIGIEMKINASDLKNQISHYEKYLVEQADNQKVLLYYLTKDGKDAPKRSKGIVDIKRVSFNKHILNWLDTCQEEVRNITNLNVALEDYKNIVKKITGKYRGNVVSIKEELLKGSEKDNLKLALIIDKEMIAIKGKILWNFFEEIRKVLEKEPLFIENITKKMLDNKRKLTEDKCKKVFKVSRNKPKLFGYYFDFGFSDDLYFNVEYGTGGLFYGIIRLENYEIKALEEKDKKRFKNGNSYKNWTSRYWKSMGGIKNLENDRILDFKNSGLKDDILKDIEKIRENRI